MMVCAGTPGQVNGAWHQQALRLPQAGENAMTSSGPREVYTRS